MKVMKVGGIRRVLVFPGIHERLVSLVITIAFLRSGRNVRREYALRIRRCRGREELSGPV